MERFPWLSYSEYKSGAYCRVCVVMGRSLDEGKGGHQRIGQLVTEPFCKWKNALEIFEAHAKSGYHKRNSELADNFLKSVLFAFGEENHFLKLACHLPVCAMSEQERTRLIPADPDEIVSYGTQEPSRDSRTLRRVEYGYEVRTSPQEERVIHKQQKTIVIVVAVLMITVIISTIWWGTSKALSESPEVNITRVLFPNFNEEFYPNAAVSSDSKDCPPIGRIADADGLNAGLQVLIHYSKIRGTHV
ncbi:hypothetical protein C0J52_16070 [Blattella germanica]|nr:hypothetical protein C0J52_16070 [Blattella germanica]